MEQVIGTVMVIAGVLLIGWKGATGETPEVQEEAVSRLQRARG